MSDKQKDWFSDIFAEFDPDRWAHRWRTEWGPRHRRRRAQVFESGEMKYVILRLLREKPRHGYEIIKELEERFGGWYSPSPGTVYPTLQLLEDQGYVKVEETEGKKVYRLTAEGDAFLDQHKDTVEEILDRVRDTVRDFAGGVMGDLSQAFGRLAAAAYKEAWRRGPNDEVTRKIVEIVSRAADEVRDLGAAR
ncbi:MAG TPA: PadR family transcriptional regulator [Gemmatimonadales bacterium]|nr:PadR family transcriptional regulator [Gemmatimonadales bacterium]